MMLVCLLSTLLTFVAATNIPSSVIDLNEKFLDVKDHGFWFVKFYAPWCAHCKRLLPVWEHVGHSVKDMSIPVKIAKLDCTRFPSVASSLHINAYPTLIFFRDGKQINFDGERKKEALVDFVIKSSSPIVKLITNATEFAQIKRRSVTDPSFLFIGDDKQLFAAFEKSANDFFTRTNFYKIKDTSFLPAEYTRIGKIIVLRDEEPKGFVGTTETLEKWISSERWPLVARAAPATLSDLATTGKLLVLIVLDAVEKNNATSPVSIFFKKSSEAAADIRNNPDTTSRLQFAWLDGGDVANNIVLGGIEVPDILVFNYSSYEYFLSPDSAANSTRASLVQWLTEVASGDIAPLGGRGVTQRVKRIVFELWTNVAQMFYSQPLLTSCLIGVPVAFLSIIVYSICSTDFSVDRDEIYPDEEESGDEDETRAVEDDDHEKAE